MHQLNWVDYRRYLGSVIGVTRLKGFWLLALTHSNVTNSLLYYSYSSSASPTRKIVKIFVFDELLRHSSFLSTKGFNSFWVFAIFNTQQKIDRIRLRRKSTGFFAGNWGLLYYTRNIFILRLPYYSCMLESATHFVCVRACSFSFVFFFFCHEFTFFYFLRIGQLLVWKGKQLFLSIFGLTSFTTCNKLWQIETCLSFCTCQIIGFHVRSLILTGNQIYYDQLRKLTRDPKLRIPFFKRK